MNDLEKLIDRPGVWTFTILAASGSNEPHYDTEIHFGLGNPKWITDLSDPKLMVKDTIAFMNFYNKFKEDVFAEMAIESDLSPQWDVSNPKWWTRNIKQRTDANHIILRVAWSAMLWNDNRILLAKMMAEAINKHLLNIEEIKYDPVLKESGLSYDGYNIPNYDPFIPQPTASPSQNEELHTDVN